MCRKGRWISFWFASKFVALSNLITLSSRLSGKLACFWFHDVLIWENMSWIWNYVLCRKRGVYHPLEFGLFGYFCMGWLTCNMLYFARFTVLKVRFTLCTAPSSWLGMICVVFRFLISLPKALSIWLFQCTPWLIRFFDWFQPFDGIKKGLHGVEVTEEEAQGLIKK